MASRQSTGVRSDQQSSGRLFILAIWTIGVFALVLRLFACWQLSGCRAMCSPTPATDMYTYLTLSSDIMSGRFSGPFYYQPFYYAVFLPVVRSIWNSPVSIAIVQAVLGAFSCVLTGFSARRLFGELAGIVSSALCALSTMLIFYAPFCLYETLHVFELALLFWLLVCIGNKIGLIMAGLVAGMAIATRGNAWLVFGVCAIWIVFAGDGGGWRKGICRALLFVAMSFVAILPFTAYNWFSGHRFILTSAARDAVLALGNTPEAPASGRMPGLPAGPMEYPESYQMAMRRSAAGYSVPHQMFDWLINHPLLFLELQLRKALFFWDYREVPNNVSLWGEGKNCPMLEYLYLGRTGVVLSLAFAWLAMFCFCRKRRESGEWLLAGFLVVLWLGTALFYNLSRFRIPIIPFACLASGGFVVDVWEHRKSHDLRRVLGLLLGIHMVYGATDTYRLCEPAIMRFVRPDGTAVPGTDGHMRCFDHGPFTFGGWTDVDAVPGTMLEKRFAVPADGFAAWRLFSQGEGELVLDDIVSGKKLTYSCHRGQNEIVTAVRGGNAALRIVSVSGGPMAFVSDAQRCYGRSSVSGIVQESEFVVELRYGMQSK
ncbi:MAG: glycosyltransferase family 39 protein [Victivallaceae bacterium]|nr:glycosyltransferase family 39 protein [Victivallaceae bacterium]